MNNNPIITILTGGVGAEREISIATSKALAASLGKDFDVDLIDIKKEELPPNIETDKTIVFPAIHGTFGEDGSLQSLLEEKGIIYSGSNPASSRLCMNKFESKKSFWK